MIFFNHNKWLRFTVWIGALIFLTCCLRGGVIAAFAPEMDSDHRPIKFSASDVLSAEFSSITAAIVIRRCDDINTASASDLQRVKGIGAAKAQAIINYRNQFGPFESLNELTRVKGIGPATIESFRSANFCVPESTRPDHSAEPESEPPSNDPAPTDCSSINTANAADLQRVKGIGASKAQAILDYRNQIEAFKSLDELTRVKGIGPATIKNFREAGFCTRESTSTDDSQAQEPSENSTDSNCTNINAANASDLERVKGIGPAKAQAILDYRKRSGAFQSLDELARVRGIGPATVANFRSAGFCIHESSGTGNHSEGQLQSSPDDSTITANSCDNINTASAADLERVMGIGPVKAQSILDLRHANGAFRSLNALLEVQGISPPTLRNFLDAGFCVEVPDTAAPLEKPAPVPYARSLYGSWWDEDGDCQDTREEVLIANSRIAVNLDEAGCEVVAGEWLDVYTDSVIVDPKWIDIDHFIPLAEVHRSGGMEWTYVDRVMYANDLSKDGALIPVSAGTNRSKGDRDPAQWLPPNESYHCQYIERWIALKETWKLTMDSDEHQTVEKIQSECMSDPEISASSGLDQ